MLKVPKMFKLLNILVFCFTCNFGFAQLTDLARLEYSVIPKHNSEDSYNRFRGLVNYPIKTSEDCYFIIGAEYNRIILDLENKYPFDVKSIKRIHVADFNMAYTFKVNNDWRFGLKFSPRIASTLTGSLGMDDVFFNGGAFAIKDKLDDEAIEKSYRLILGLTYNSTTGLPFPLPFISYHRRINENWAYNLGIPKTNAKYYFNEANIMQLFFAVDGYYANVHDKIIIDNKEVDNISMNAIVGGLGYEYCFTKHLVAYAYSGYTLKFSNSLRDSNRDKLFNLDNVNTFYIRTGIKFKI